MFNIIILLTFLLFSGCGFTNLIGGEASERAFDAYVAGRNELLSDLQIHVGKSSSEIMAVFGKPTIVRDNYVLHKIRYDEGWEYKRSKDNPVLRSDEYAIIFLFNDGHVSNIDVE